MLVILIMVIAAIIYQVLMGFRQHAICFLYLISFNPQQNSHQISYIHFTNGEAEAQKD